MKHFTITYDPTLKNLKIYFDGKLQGGMIGRIAENRFNQIKAEMAVCDRLLNKAKRTINETRTDKTESEKKAI